MSLLNLAEGCPQCNAAEGPIWRGCEGGCCTHSEIPGNTCEGCGTKVCK